MNDQEYSDTDESLLAVSGHEENVTFSGEDEDYTEDDALHRLAWLARNRRHRPELARENENSMSSNEWSVGDDRDARDEYSDDSDEELLRGHSALEQAINALAAISQRRHGDSEGPQRLAQDGQSLFAEAIHRMIGGGEAFLGGLVSSELSEITALVDNLAHNEDSYIILETLNELSERLLMMNGITAERLVPSDKLSKHLVRIMQDISLQDELELQLVACRCLYNLLEVNEDFVNDVVLHDAVKALCEKLLQIEYIDLRDQALQTLEVISRDPISHESIVEYDGLLSCLTYLDFMTLHSQKKCLYICLNVCTMVSTLHFDKIKAAFPNICAATSLANEGIAEQAWLAISRLVSSYRLHPDLLELLFADNPELLSRTMRVIVVSMNSSNNGDSDTGESRLSFGVCLDLVKSIVVLESASVALSRTLLKYCKIGDVLIACLGRFLNDKQVTIGALMAAPKQLVAQILNVIAYLIPVVPTTQSTLELQAFSRLKMNTDRLAMCRDEINNEFTAFLTAVLPILVNSFQAWLDHDMRRKILIIISRILSFDLAPFLHQDMSGITSMLISVTSAYVAQRDAKSSVDSVDRSDVTHDKSSGSAHIPHTLSNRRGSFRSGVPAQCKIDSLLSQALKVACILVSVDPQKFVLEFGKEGLFDDVSAISGAIKGCASDSDARSSTGPPALSINCFRDPELAEDADSRLPQDSADAVISKFAQSLLLDYKRFQSDSSGNSSIVATTLETCNLISSQLGDYDKYARYSKDQWVELWEQTWTALSDDSGLLKMTSYELVSFKFVDHLSVLLGKSPQSGSGSDHAACAEAFILVFFVNHDHTLVFLLIEKLQDLLLRSESFEVVTCGAKAGLMGYGAIQSDSIASVMTSQVKLKLVMANSHIPMLPLGMQNLTLSVHAIATFKSVAAFLNSGLSSFTDADNNLARDLGTETDEPETESCETSEQPSDEDRFEFSINGASVPTTSTVFGAIYKALACKKGDSFDVSQVWNSAHQVEVRVNSDKKIADASHESQQNLETAALEFSGKSSPAVLHLLSAIFDMTTGPQGRPRPGLTGVQPRLLNWQLTVKLNRQLDEVLIVASGVIPEWAIFLVSNYPFLFPFDTRIRFFQSTSFGYLRLIHSVQSRLSSGTSDSDARHDAASNNPHFHLGRSSRQKVRLSRDQILHSAMKVLTAYGTTPRMLEIEFYDEIGSGLGPTLEFYALVSREFCAHELGLWRHNGLDVVEGFSQKPLFPRPLSKNERESDKGRKILQFFEGLGMFVARALIDSRILDFNFNPSWLAAVQQLNRGHGIFANKRDRLAALESVDPEFANSVKFLQNLTSQGYNISPEKGQVASGTPTFKDLSLTFELPGYPEYELISGGSNIFVTDANVNDYIDKVLDATVGEGIISQTREFMRGFSRILNAQSLNIFSPVELTQVFGNASEDWSGATLTSVVVANHGYSKNSDAIKSLVSILESLHLEDKRKFLSFLTGSPRLPIGGFKALEPPITVVRKFADDPLTDDDYLPSVMTCVNYLKLPNYTSLDVMRKRLFQAMNEGAGSFFLS